MAWKSDAKHGNDISNNSPFPLTAIDRELLAMSDDDFQRITWVHLNNIIANNNLENLKRLPSDLRRYLRWSYETKLGYGTITNFVVQERLRWVPCHDITATRPVTATSFTHHSVVPFQDTRDFTILQNDWPYGFTADITHIVVWSRTPIAVDQDKGDVTVDSRGVIESFVRKTFVQKLAADEGVGEQGAASRVLWFKNWVSLQSVRGVDHIHVLVRNVSQRLLHHWTASTTAK